MTTAKNVTLGALALAALLASTGCSNMSYRDQAMAVGATAGAVAGSALTTGSPGGIVAGAIIGGVVGDEVGKRR